MVFFHSLEERARSASTDAYLEQGRDLLTDPAVLRSMGDVATDLIDIIDNKFYRPNIRHGVISKPRHTPSDKVPVLSIYPGEKFVPKRKDTLQMTDDQLNSLTEYFTSSGMSEMSSVGHIALIASRLKATSKNQPHSLTH